jgi:hypothetical protein
MSRFALTSLRPLSYNDLRNNKDTVSLVDKTDFSSLGARRRRGEGKENRARAGVVELVDAGDSKSPGPCVHASSILASGTNEIKGLTGLWLAPFVYLGNVLGNTFFSYACTQWNRSFTECSFANQTRKIAAVSRPIDPNILWSKILNLTKMWDSCSVFLIESAPFCSKLLCPHYLTGVSGTSTQVLSKLW